MQRLIHIRMKHLRLLEQLVEHRTLRKAADALHVSEPAASQMLRDMESTFGVTLFERGRRGMTPNQASTLLVNRARVILRELHAMATDINDLLDQKNELIHLGALPRCMYMLVPTAMAHLYSQGFKPRIQITEGSSSQLLESLNCGKLDLALTRVTHEYASLLSETRFEITKLLDERTVIICSLQHPLSQRTEVTLPELLHCDWVLPTSDSMTRVVIDTEFINSGLKPPTPKVEGNTATSLKLVQNSHFLSICPATVAADWQANHLLHILPIKLQTSLPPISMIRRTSKADSQVIGAIEQALLKFSDL